jgi:hypothetical protein
MIARTLTIRTLFTLFVSGLAIAPISYVHSEEISLSLRLYCERWRDNALAGARQQMRGATRQFQYENVATLAAMKEHGIDNARLFLVAKEYSSEERQFLEASTLAGYDRLAAFRATYPNDNLNYESWKRELFEECLSESRETPQSKKDELWIPPVSAQ